MLSFEIYLYQSLLFFCMGNTALPLSVLKGIIQKKKFDTGLLSTKSVWFLKVAEAVIVIIFTKYLQSNI